MRIALAIGLLVIGATLWYVSNRSEEDGGWLDRVEKIGSVLSGVLALILLAFPNIVGQEQSDSGATQTVEHNSAETISTPSIDSPTSDPAKSITLIPTVNQPTETNRFDESFDDEESDWFTGQSTHSWGTVETYIQDGRYHWTADVQTDYFFDIDMPPMPNVSDFEYEVEFASTAGAAQYGLYFRRTGHSYYYFPINDGNYAFSIWDSDVPDWKPIIRFESHSAVNIGGANTLKVVAQDNLFSLYINDQLVTERKDDTFAGGTVGIVFAMKANQNVHAEIEHFYFATLK